MTTVANSQTYVDLLTSQHRTQPDFAAMVAMTCQPFVDAMNLLSNIPSLFDIDQAVGQQLDVLGKWIGVARNMTIAISNIYFAWDTPGVGWDQGVWKKTSDPSTGIVALPDDHYRALLKSKVLNNHWDCDIPDAYTLMNAVFSTFGYSIGIKDNGNLTMELFLIGPNQPDVLLSDMFTSGLLDVRPVGVTITNRSYVPSLALLDSTFILDVSKLA